MEPLAKYLSIDERYGWFNRFAEGLEKAQGFEAIENNPIPIEPRLLNMKTENAVAVLSDVAKVFERKSGPEQGSAIEEMQEVALRIQCEHDDGRLFAWNWHVGIARKACM